MSVLGKLMQVSTRAVREEFAEEGSSWAPKWLLENEHGHRVLIATPFDDDDPGYKAKLADHMRKAIKNFGAVAYTYCVETWFVHVKDDDNDGRRPSERPDRREAIFIMGEDIKGNQQSLMIEVKRNGSKATLGKAEFGGEAIASAFTDMFSVGPYK